MTFSVIKKKLMGAEQGKYQRRLQPYGIGAAAGVAAVAGTYGLGKMLPPMSLKAELRRDFNKAMWYADRGRLTPNEQRELAVLMDNLSFKFELLARRFQQDNPNLQPEVKTPDVDQFRGYLDFLEKYARRDEIPELLSSLQGLLTALELTPREKEEFERRLVRLEARI